MGYSAERCQIVKDAYDKGIHTTDDLMAATGLPRSTVNDIKTNLRNKGEIGPKTEEELKIHSRKGILNNSTMQMIEEINKLLAVVHPQTVRQVFYGLVVKELVENLKTEYANVSNWITNGRLQDLIPWEYIEDRTRAPQRLNFHDSLEEFAFQVSRWYRSNWWQQQERRIVFWCEKDALAGVIWPVVRDYGVPMYIGKGFDSWSSIKDAAEDFGTGEDVTILYAGDLDTAGVFINESLMSRLARLGCHPEMVRIALNPEQQEKWKLKASYAKRAVSKLELPEGEVSQGVKAWATRVKKFIEEYGDIAIELDAIPPLEFRKLIKEEIESRIDLPALRTAQAKDECARERIQEAIEDVYLADCSDEDE
jgi:hypothetical protein